MTQPADMIPTPEGTGAPPSAPPAPALLMGPDGSVYRFDDPTKALATGQYRPLSPQETLTHQVAKEERAKGLLGSVEEGAKSAGNQFLLGIPGVIQDETDTPEERAHREAVDEYHQTARLLGGAVGFGGSMLAGGMGLFKGAELAGQAVERGIMPAEELAHASLGVKLAATAANYAAQGAVMASPQALVQAAFGDPQKAAETLLWGVGAGAALGGAGELLKAGAGAVGEGLGNLLEKATSIPAGKDVSPLEQFSIDRSVKAIGGERSQINKLSQAQIKGHIDFAHDEGIIKPGMSREDIGAAIDQVHKKYGQQIGDTIDSLDSLGQGAPREVPLADIRGASKPADEDTAQRLASIRGARDRGKELPPIALDRDESGGLVVRDGLHRLQVARELGDTTIRARIRDMASELPFDAAQQFLKPGEIGDKIMAALDSPELRMPMNADQRKALETVVESAHMMPTTKINGQEVVSFEDAQNFVSSLRKKWVNSVSRAQSEGGVKGLDVVTPLDQMKAAAYQVARDAVHAAGDRVAQAAGEPSLIGKLAEAKQAYAHVAELEKWAATRERQAAGNRMIGLTDFIHMGSGGVVGAGIGGMLGGAIGGPPGAAAGAMVGKVSGAVLALIAKHWAEDRGLVYLSALAHRAAKDGPEVFSAVMASEGAKRLEATMSGVRDTVKQLAMRGIEDVAARKQTHMAALLGSTAGLTPDQSYNKLGARLTQLAANPAALSQVTSSLASPYSSTAPAVSDAYQAKLAQTIGYLYQSLPKASAPPAPFAPQSWQPTAQDKLAFHDKAEIVANPMVAMQHVRQGTLSNAHLEALKTIYPVVYAMMQHEILNFSVEHPDVKLPLPERQSIAKFLGTSLDSLDTPSAVRALQGAYVSAGPGGSQGAPTGQKVPKGKIRKMPSMATTFASTEGPST